MRYAVVGGGAAGLTLAWRLARAGESVTLYESEPRAGGLASGFRVGTAALERFYHHIFRSDRTIIRIIDEVGLLSQLRWQQPQTSVIVRGRSYPLDSVPSLLRFGPLPMVDRLRMGAALAVLKTLPSPTPLEGETAARWIRRWMGERAYATIWGPLLRAKFGEHAAAIAAPWFWARIHDRSRDLGYVRGGFQRLYDALAESVRAAGGITRFGTRVEQVVTTDQHHLRVTTATDTCEFDRVILCLSPRVSYRIAPQLPAWFRQRYDPGDALAAHCLILALDRSFTDAYWLNITAPTSPFTVVVEHTNLMPASDYGGRRLLYVGAYRPPNDPRLTLTPEQHLDLYLPHLQRINPAFSRAWVTETWGFGARDAQPVVTRDYRGRISPSRTPVPGLYLANMFQVYPHDRGQNYSMERAERLAQRLLLER